MGAENGQKWPKMAKFSLDNLQNSKILPTHHFREALEKKWPKNSLTAFNSNFSHFGAWKWQKMANNGQKWSNFLQYSIILPTHHFKEALEKKMKINWPPQTIKGLDNTLCARSPVCYSVLSVCVCVCLSSATNTNT